MKWNKIILKNFGMFQCFILTWNHGSNHAVIDYIRRHQQVVWRDNKYDNITQLIRQVRKWLPVTVYVQRSLTCCLKLGISQYLQQASFVLICFFVPDRGAKYCDERVCICLSVCSVRQRVWKNTSKLHELLCTCYPGPRLDPRLTTVEYVMYFRF